MSTAERALLQFWVGYAPWANLAVDDDAITAQMSRRQLRWRIAAWPVTAAASLAEDEVLVADRLGSKLRRSMARRGRSYADRGVLHLVHDGLLIHLERADANGATAVTPRRATRSLTPSGVRAVTLMLGERGATWSVRRLHERAHLSLGSAQQVLSTLDQAGMLSVRGSGADLTRRVRDPGELLDWFAEQPAARRAPVQVQVIVYGRGVRDVVHKVGSSLTDADCRYAISGLAAATLGGVGPTEVPVVKVWVDKAADLSSLMELGPFRPVTRGANVALCVDANGSGLIGGVTIDDVVTSAPARVYLDLLDQPRGEDVATTYRRTHLGY